MISKEYLKYWYKDFFKKKYLYLDNCKNYQNCTIEVYCFAMMYTYTLHISCTPGISRYSSQILGWWGVPVAWLGAPEQKVAHVGWGNGCVPGVVRSSGRSFTGWEYRSSLMVGVKPYRVVFERGVGRVERAVCAAERPTECAVRPI